MAGGERSRVLVLMGTRPEAIKLAPVVEALGGRPSLECRLVLTGQHADLVDEVLSSFGLEPDWDLAVMREGQSLLDLGCACLAGVHRVLREWRPDLVLVQGDTASVFFGSLAGFFEGVPTGHVEAGLRTDELRKPFPEEGFRRLTGVLAELHFAPTERARRNLLREGVPDDRIHVTGNTVVDALLNISGRETPTVSPVVRRLIAPDGPPFLLLTAHRRESFGSPLERVFQGVRELVEEQPGLEVVFPVHPNPNVVEPAQRLLGGHDRIHLIDPLNYPDLVAVLARARGVLTDSGGIQEEAPTFGTPVLVLREVTERPEGIEAGVARLVGTDPVRIVEEGRRLLGRTAADRDRDRRSNPYGDGYAGGRIADRVENFLARRMRDS